MALTDCPKCWMSEEHCLCNSSSNASMRTWLSPESLPPALPSRKAIEYAHYILNHYSRDSINDQLCLARDLEKHGWHP